MNSVKITLSSGNPFPQHQPGSITYFVGFAAKTDLLHYEVGLAEPLNIPPGDTVTFDIVPSVGNAIKFVGVLYRAKSMGKANRYRLTFVSKYYRGLMSCEPLFGRGNIADIAGNFYSKAGVPKIIKDPSDVSIDNIVFPQNTRTDDAIAYLLARATAANDSFLVGTVVGDTAYIRDIKKGTEDIKGFNYQPIAIVDNRRKIDMMGGINMNLASDAEAVDNQTSKSTGTNQVKVNQYSGIPDTNQARAKLRVEQRRIYYSGYVVTIGSPGWIPLMGSTIVVDKEVVDNQSWFRTLIRGKYFVNSQQLFMDFSSSYPKMQAGIQLVDDK